MPMMTKAALATVLATVLLACVSPALGATQSTLQDPKNAGQCLQRFEAIITTYYANDTNCGDLITKAMNETVPAQCPGGTATAGSSVHQCMNKNNTMPAITDAWSSFIRNCEVMYIANRGGQGESEEGFTYLENSCFPRFNSFNEFQAWLTDARPYGGQQLTVLSSANAMRVALSGVAAAMVLAVAAVWA